MNYQLNVAKDKISFLKSKTHFVNHLGIDEEEVNMSDTKDEVEKLLADCMMTFIQRIDDDRYDL